jgi:hypothetical protein
LTAELERSGLKLGEASSEVVVLETSLEELSRGQNRSTLSRIATAAQGSYLEPDEFLKLELKPEPVTRTVQFIPRLSPWLYLLFTVLFGLELFLRKSRGLS